MGEEERTHVLHAVIVGQLTISPREDGEEEGGIGFGVGTRL